MEKELHDLIEMPASNYVSVYTWFLLINQLANQPNHIQSQGWRRQQQQVCLELCQLV